MATRQLDEFLEGIDSSEENNENGQENADVQNENSGVQHDESQGSDQGVVENQNDDQQQQQENNDLTNNENGDAGDNAGGDTSESDNNDQLGISIEEINRAIDGQYGSLDEIKERLSLSDEIESLRAREREHLEILESVTNPKEFFASEKDYIGNEIKKNNKGLSSFVVNKLLEADNIDEMDAEEALVLNHVMKTPAHQRDLGKVKSLIRRKYGLNKSLDGIEDEDEKRQAEEEYELNKMSLESDAQEAKEKFKQLLDVKIPEKTKIDEVIEARKQERESRGNELKQKFEPVLQGMAKNLSSVKLTYPDGNSAMDFSVSEEQRPALLEGMRKTAVSLGLDPSKKEDVQKLGNYAQNYLIAKNISKILKAHEENIVARMKDKEYQDHHVAGSQNLDQGRSSSDHTETNADIVRREAKRKD